MTQIMIALLTGAIISYTFLTYQYKRLVKNKKQRSDNEKMLIGLVENSRDGFYHFEVKPKWKFRYSYPPFEVTFGKEQGELVYDNPLMAFERVHPDDRDQLFKKVKGEIDYDKPVIYRIAMGEEAFNKGEYRLFEEYTTPVYQDGELVAIQGILRDITEKKELEEKLEYRITHDSLTGVYNREYFDRQMEKYEEEEDTAFGIIIIDLDNLKITNDTYGHRQGDRLIKEAAGILKTYSSKKVVVSRVGGDEFVILLVGTNSEEIEGLVQRIHNDVNIYNSNNQDIEVHLSVGYAFSEQSIGKMENVYMEADRKMYENKRKRKGR
ncbi:sensor domain-containing diguanylate cyclase [Saccharibacillus kuerlensis]|uniref:GGDEF domain-containing protein n=1 Tax=Saccharibacillus kuerlensis TaxID=459527 RepID=A0ABQ2L8K2_9BACL|nr:sensor domain-containing diguanylate cyclase [Saccharibacillus kuerlensis]GGO06488.1 hypothetical protein GCM10010969_34040 [Saccharibacillus kuerlensis]